MDAITAFLKGCMRANDEDDTNSVAGESRPTPSEEEEASIDEVPLPVEIAKVYAEFREKAKAAWEDDAKSVIWRGRSDGNVHLASTTDDGRLGLPNHDERNSSLGDQVMRHSASLMEIHAFFLRLDPRRFDPQVNSNLDRPCSGAAIKAVQNQGSRMKSRWKRAQEPVLQMDVFLNEPEKSLYKRVLQCANFPVLSSPAAEPSVTPPSQGAWYSSSSPEGDTVLSPTDKVSIDPEMLMTCLREAFGITQRIHNQYYNQVRQLIPNKDPSKLLLSELQDRLYQLETNQHNYYRIGSFLDRNGYPRWRNTEIEAIRKLIRRFWRRDLPGHLGMEVSSVDAHSEYRLLQEKLFKFEMRIRMDSNSTRSGRDTLSVFPVSTAAKKILKEFALRYGICSLFRQISALMCMAKNFEYDGWYIKCCTQAVFEIKSMLQCNYQMMVQDEYRMLIAAVALLQDCIEHTLKSIKLLCPKKLPFDTVSWMLETLRAIVRIQDDLGVREDGQPTEEKYISDLFERSIQVGFNDFKGKILIHSEIETPQMLRTLLVNIRDELKFYKDLKEQCPDLTNYVDIERLATSKLYSLLINDVRSVCIERMELEEEASSIDVEMLRLAYLLSRLDKDWACYIEPRAQKWRIYFMTEVKSTMKATSLSINRLIRKFIGKDQWKILEFENNFTDRDGAGTTSSPSVKSYSNTIVSVTSLVPSESSAFSRVVPNTSPKNPVKDIKGIVRDACSKEEMIGTNLMKDDETVDEDVGRQVEVCDVVEDAISNTSNHMQSIGEGSIPVDQSSSSVAESAPSQSSEFLPVKSLESLASLSPSVCDSSGSKRETNQSQGSLETEICISRDICDSQAMAVEVLEEILADICASEDEMVEDFVDSVLRKALHSIRQESCESYSYRGCFLQRPSFPSSFLDSSQLTSCKSTQSICNSIITPKPTRMVNGSSVGDYRHSKDQSNHISFSDGVFLRRNSDGFKASNSTMAFSFPSTSCHVIKDETDNESLPKCKSENLISCTFLKNTGLESCMNGKQFSSQLSRALKSADETDYSGSTELISTTSTLRVSMDTLPSKGKILASSSFFDTLMTIERTSGLFKELYNLLVPFNSNVSADFQTRNEAETFSGHLFEGLTKSIKETLVTYADGVLALDLCGWNDEDLSTLIGSHIVERLREKQRTGLISGCCHDLSRRMSMNAFNTGQGSRYCAQVLRVIKYCVGECEAISAEICTRLNNVQSLIDLLEPIELHARSACGISSPDSNANDISDSSIIRKARKIGSLELARCKGSLETICSSQVSIIGQRVAVMLGKIADLLLSLSLKWAARASYKDQLKPIAVFLQHQMEVLRENLYLTSLKAVVMDIWQRLIKIFHNYADILRFNRTNPRYDAERYIQLMSICLKHLLVDGDTGDKLTAICQPVLFRFQLYSYRPEQLKLILDISNNMASEDHYILRDLNCKETLLNMRSRGALKRVFTGEDFVQVLLENRSWLNQFKVDESQDDLKKAIAIGDILLEREMITCVEFPAAEAAFRYVSPSTSRGSADLSVVHVGSRVFVLSPDLESGADDGISEAEDAIVDGFQPLSTYSYKINVASCNVSDISIKVCRVLRQTDRRFIPQLNLDIMSILEYRSYWKKEHAFLDILKIVVPQKFRPKAFSWPLR